MSNSPFAKRARLLEARAPAEALSSLAVWPALLAGRRGDGHPVLVLPGLLAGDASTTMLRAFLRQRGWAPFGWGQGRNLGPKPGVLDAALQQLRQLHVQSGRKASVIGQSLGGVYARLLASEAPDAVRLVITLGSPVGAGSRAGPATQARRVYEAAAGAAAYDTRRAERLRQALAVPSTSIYSRSDGVVPWQHSVLADSALGENVEVRSSHLGMAMHPQVLHIIADRLLQPEGGWRPFRRGGALHRMHAAGRR